MLEDLAKGELLPKACETAGIQWRDFYHLLNRNDEISQRYAAARKMGIDAMVEQMLHLAANTQVGVERTKFADGSVQVKMSDMLGHRKLQIDTLKWYVSKMLPKKYGDGVGLLPTDSPDESARKIRAALELIDKVQGDKP